MHRAWDFLNFFTLSPFARLSLRMRGLSDSRTPAREGEQEWMWHIHGLLADREKWKEAFTTPLPPPHLAWAPSQSCLSIQLRSRPRVC